MPEYELTPVRVVPFTEDFLEVIREEMDGYYQQMKDFRSQPLDEIFMLLAGWTARMSELRSLLVRRENRRAMALRTKEVEPFIDECDRQFKLWSRLQSVREAEIKLGGGVM